MALETHSTIMDSNNHVLQKDSVHGESVQQELKIFYNSLNAEEKEQLKKFAKTNAANFSFTDGQFLEGLKNEAVGLFDKLTDLRDVINNKLDGMQPESRLFIENVLRRFLAAFSQDGIMNILKSLKGFGKDTIEIFDGLSKPVQSDILNAFPVIGSYVTSDIARLILKKIAELDLISKTSPSISTVGQKQDSSEKPLPDTSGHHFPDHDPEPIELEGPGHSDPEPMHYTPERKKGFVSSTVYPLIDGEEMLSIKKVLNNK